MTRTGTIACCLAIGGSGFACGWMAFGLGPVLVASGVLLFAWWAVPAWVQRRRCKRALKSLQAAWDESRDGTGGVQ